MKKIKYLCQSNKYIYENIKKNISIHDNPQSQKKKNQKNWSDNLNPELLYH